MARPPIYRHLADGRHRQPYQEFSSQRALQQSYYQRPLNYRRPARLYNRGVNSPWQRSQYRHGSGGYSSPSTLTGYSSGATGSVNSDWSRADRRRENQMLHSRRRPRGPSVLSYPASGLLFSHRSRWGRSRPSFRSSRARPMRSPTSGILQQLSELSLGQSTESYPSRRSAHRHDDGWNGRSHDSSDNGSLRSSHPYSVYSSVDPSVYWSRM